MWEEWRERKEIRWSQLQVYCLFPFRWAVQTSQQISCLCSFPRFPSVVSIWQQFEKCLYCCLLFVRISHFVHCFLLRAGLRFETLSRQSVLWSLRNEFIALRFQLCDLPCCVVCTSDCHNITVMLRSIFSYYVRECSAGLNLKRNRGINLCKAKIKSPRCCVLELKLLFFSIEIWNWTGRKGKNMWNSIRNLCEHRSNLNFPWHQNDGSEEHKYISLEMNDWNVCVDDFSAIHCWKTARNPSEAAMFLRTIHLSAQLEVHSR